MRVVEIYATIAIIDVAILVAILMVIGIKYKDSNISLAIGGSTKVTERMLVVILDLYYSKEGWKKPLLTILGVFPIINIAILVILLNGVLPREAELIVDYYKDDWKIEIYQYGNINFAVVNDEFNHKALVTDEALDYLLELPENKIKFYLSIFKVCINEAVSENNYKIIMTMTEKGLSFEKIGNL